MLYLAAQSCLTVCDPPRDCSSPGSPVLGDSPGKNTGVGCHALLQEIFPIQGPNPGLPHCRRILYCLSHQWSPRSTDNSLVNILSESPGIFVIWPCSTFGNLVDGMSFFFSKYQVGKQKSSFIDWTWIQKTKFIGKSSKSFFIKIKTFPLTQTCALFVNSSFKAVNAGQFLKTQVIRCIQLFEKVKKLTEKYYRQT